MPKTADQTQLDQKLHTENIWTAKMLLMQQLTDKKITLTQYLTQRAELIARDQETRAAWAVAS